MQETIPKPATPFTTNGGLKLYDAKGDTVTPAKSTLMARLNEKGKEDITITKGTLALIGGSIALLGLAITCLVLFVGWVRSDEGVRVNQGVMQKDIDEMRQDMRDIKQQLNEWQKAQQAQAVKDAETKGKTQGYQLGVTETQADHGKK